MVILPQPTEGVLDVDDRIVDQATQGHGQSTERHDVDRHAGPGHDDERAAERQGQRCQRDDGGSDIEQEHHQHDGDDHRRFDQHLLEIGDAVLDEIRLAEYRTIEVHAGGQRHRGHRPIQVVGQRQGIGPWCFLDRDHHRRRALFAGCAARLRCGQANVSDITDHHRRTIAPSQDGALDVIHRLDLCRLPDGDLLPTLVRKEARAGGGVGTTCRGDHIGHGQSVETQTLLTWDDLVFWQFTAHGDDLRDPRNPQQAIAQVELGKGAQFQRRARSIR